MALDSHDQVPESDALEIEEETSDSCDELGAIATSGDCSSLMTRYPVLSLLAFAAAGMSLGLCLSVWDPENDQYKEVSLQWIGLLGDMFIRALKAVVLPLVFVNVVVSVVDMMSVGRASTVGGKALGLYFLTTLMASISGLISIVCFKNVFEQDSFGEDPPSYGKIRLGCDEDDSFLVHTEEGELSCLSNLTDEGSSYFYITDVDKMFVAKSSGPKNDLSMSDTIYDGVFGKLITSNIFESLVEANFAAVVLFAVCMGAALAKDLQINNATQVESPLVALLQQVDRVMLLMIKAIMKCTPIAIMSLIASAVGKQENLKESFQNVGYLVLATLLAMVVHVLLTYVGLFALITKSNPFSYLKFMIPAQTTAFACASSAATMPLTMQCVKNSGMVPDPIAKFVIPMGGTINMDGGAIYFPCACIWMAVLNGLSPTFTDYVLLIILATVGSAGTAPVPSASLVLIITAYNTVFGTTGTPDGFSMILAIDWFMDRCRTLVNVTGDTVVTGIVAATVTPKVDNPNVTYATLSRVTDVCFEEQTSCNHVTK